MQGKDAAEDGRGEGPAVGWGRFPRPVRGVFLMLPALAGLILTGLLLWPAPGETPNPVRVGVLPDQSPEVLEQRFDPLLKYLSDEIGVPFRLVVPADYADLLDRFSRQEIDIAYFGGLTYLKAREAEGARALVMRDVDTRFRSSFIAAVDRPETTIADFLDKSLAFGSELSTSGHLMPRHFLLQESIDPESWFSDIVYSGAHDATAILVQNGNVDLGVANSEVIEAMFRDGRLRRSEIRVVVRTPPYVDYVWAMRVGIDAGLYDRVMFAFLKLSPLDGAHANILDRLGAGAFLPARDSDFGSLRDIAISLDLLG